MASGLTQKRYRIKHTYGITLEEFDALVEAQGNRCKICGEHETRWNNKSKRVQDLSIDHDHATGIIRGLLCNACNVGLGQFQDDPELLQKALDYLDP